MSGNQHSDQQEQLRVIAELRQQIHAIDLESDRKVTPFSGPSVTLGQETSERTSYWLEQSQEEPFPESLQDCELLEPEEPEIQLCDDFKEEDCSPDLEEVEEERFRVSVDKILPIQKKSRRIISTGNAVWDSWFPDGGIAAGSIIQWLSPSAGSGALHLIFDIAKKICLDDGLFVVIDPKEQVYPGSLLSCGFDLKKVLFVHPANQSEQLWAWEQCLSDEFVSAVWTSLDQADSRYQRRWQLAARKGGAVGLLSRPANVAHLPAWSDAQFFVKPVLSVDKQRKPTAGKKIEHTEISNEDWVLEVQALRCKGLFGKPKVQITLENEILHTVDGDVQSFQKDVMKRSFGN